jgi:hypothetical protein
MVEDIKKYREMMVPMVHDLKERQERVQLLAEEQAKLPKNLNRYSNFYYSSSLCYIHFLVERYTLIALWISPTLLVS